MGDTTPNALTAPPHTTRQQTPQIHDHTVAPGKAHKDTYAIHDTAAQVATATTAHMAHRTPTTATY